MFKLTKPQQIYIIVALAVISFVIIFYFTDSPNNEITLLNTTEQEYKFLSDPQKLLNITFTYNLNNKNVCSNNTQENILAVFIVTSYFGNVETRSSMRQAFSIEDLRKKGLRRVFLLGEASRDKYTTQKSINDESRRFGDIIQGNFSEAYRNLTYKHIMGLKWASTYCPNAKYLIKMDDDTVVNMYILKTMLKSLENIYNKDFIAGYKLENMLAIRQTANKWYVTKEEYPSTKYPTFVSGWFYITKPQTALKLATIANYQKYFWIDDVFVTGIIAKKLKILLFDISKYFVINSEFLQCCLQDLNKKIDCDIYVGPNGGDDNMFYKFNEKIKLCLNEGCIKRSKPLNETCVAEKKVNLGKGDPEINDFRLS
ncbi:unnamed protein product [Ceutorhynchus assimilis]|uniref:Hexosyltransferase n=1 Tax=Ceutorhynchus assimilis TaxID=467358 RepID=A0A9N9QA91_9CUCU|nr:unnamed protein product [Ceutorhynchus assimilis]